MDNQKYFILYLIKCLFLSDLRLVHFSYGLPEIQDVVPLDETYKPIIYKLEKANNSERIGQINNTAGNPPQNYQFSPRTVSKKDDALLDNNSKYFFRKLEELDDFGKASKKNYTGHDLLHSTNNTVLNYTTESTITNRFEKFPNIEKGNATPNDKITSNPNFKILFRNLLSNSSENISQRLAKENNTVADIRITTETADGNIFKNVPFSNVKYSPNFFILKNIPKLEEATKPTFNLALKNILTGTKVDPFNKNEPFKSFNIKSSTGKNFENHLFFRHFTGNADNFKDVRKTEPQTELLEKAILKYRSKNLSKDTDGFEKNISVKDQIKNRSDVNNKTTELELTTPATITHSTAYKIISTMNVTQKNDTAKVEGTTTSGINRTSEKLPSNMEKGTFLGLAEHIATNIFKVLPIGIIQIICADDVNPNTNTTNTALDITSRDLSEDAIFSCVKNVTAKVIDFLKSVSPIHTISTKLTKEFPVDTNKDTWWLDSIYEFFKPYIVLFIKIFEFLHLVYFMNG